MKVRDLLNNIENYRKKYPDIDDWDVYTEQPDLMAPNKGITHKEWLEKIEQKPNVFFSDKEGQWVAVSGLNDIYYFNNEKEARDFANNWDLYMESLREEMTKSMVTIHELEDQGWKFVYDSEGWVYRDVADDGNHTLFVEDKIITINNNY